MSKQSKVNRVIRFATIVVAALAAMFSAAAAAQRTAFTFDDGPDMNDHIGLSPQARNEAILGQLAAAHLKSILFVTRTNAERSWNELIRARGRAGHQIGNHTATHPDFQSRNRIR